MKESGSRSENEVWIAFNGLAKNGRRWWMGRAEIAGREVKKEGAKKRGKFT